MRSRKLFCGVLVAVLAAFALACAGKQEPVDPELDLGVAGGSGTIQQTAEQGGPNPAPSEFTLLNTGNCRLSFTVQRHTADGETWLQVSPTSGTLNPQVGTATLTVGIDVVSTALRPGTYTGTIRVDAICIANGQPPVGSPRLVSVNVAVRPIFANLTASTGAVAFDVPTLANSWTAMSTVDQPAARSELVFVWTGYRGVVWGGRDFFNSYSTGSRYDPMSDTWSPTSDVGAPLGRQRHGGVYTGSLLIVWGGERIGAGARGDGGRYDPVADTWSPTSGTGAPAPRFQHSTVWTGQEMVVWGGTDGATHHPGGGRYDPAADTWTATAAAGAPAARREHSAVWTGKEMVVFGGRDNGTTAMASGGRYDPSTNTWTSLAAPGAPSARYGHAAVWTGARMIVWGGRASSTTAPFNTGALYDPASNRWTPTSTVGAPSARSHASAVWTGKVLVVWGGDGGTSGSTLSDTGGIYDSVADTWTATATSGAPQERSGAPALWTGLQMLVWGGGVSGGLPTAGGILQ